MEIEIDKTYNNNDMNLSLRSTWIEITYKSNKNLRKIIHHDHVNNMTEISYEFLCPDCDTWETYITSNIKRRETRDLWLMSKNDMLLCCECFDDIYENYYDT